jgi:RNA polymerase sigma-70 factor (ECF subfamily)
MVTTQPSLLERLRQSPAHGAWERFVELYTPVLVAWTHHLGLNRHDAADLIQDIFAVLVVQLPNFHYDEQKSFRAWLKTILLNRWRRLRKKHAQQQTITLNGSRADLPAEDNGFEMEEEEYRRHLLQQALALMQVDFEPVTWKACWEYVVRDRPAAEVATELGITVNAVYLAKSRVLRRLRSELEGFLE